MKTGFEIGSVGIQRFVVGFTPVGRQIFPRATRRVVHIMPMEPRKFTFITGKRKPGFTPTPSPTPTPAPSTALSVGLLTDTRLTSWGTNATKPTITSIFKLVWGSSTVAQGFFQAGGQLRLRLSQPLATAQDLAWQAMFTNMNVLTLFTNATLINGTGSGGTVNSAKGYNQLATAQPLYTGVGAAPFQANDYTIVAQQISGGVQFTVTLNDVFPSIYHSIYTYPAGDVVDAGTTVAVDVFYFLNNAATPLPTGTVISSFS